MKLIIIGAGKYGKEIEDIAEQMNQFASIAFLDDNPKADNVIGKCADFERYHDHDTAFFVAFGDNDFREKISLTLTSKGVVPINIIHPTAYISPKAILGQGISILPKAVVNTYTTIKDGCMINTGAIVDHDCIIEPYTHVCVGAIVKADNHIPAKMKIEAGVVVERETYV